MSENDALTICQDICTIIYSRSVGASLKEKMRTIYL